MAGQWLSNQTTGSLFSHVSLQIRRLTVCFVLPSRTHQGCASTPVSSDLCFPFFQFRFVLGPFLFLAWCDPLARECSLSFMIYHSSSATSSSTFSNSSHISSGCILSIKNSSPYLLYLMPVFLRPPLLVSFIIFKPGSVHFGTSFCCGSIQSSSSSAKDPSSESTSIFFCCHSCSRSRCHHSSLWCLPRSLEMLVLPVDTRVLQCSVVRTNLPVMGREVSDFRSAPHALSSSDRTDSAGAFLLS